MEMTMEMEMAKSILKSLHFVEMPERPKDELAMKRNSLLKRLTEQKGKLLNKHTREREGKAPQKIRQSWVEDPEDGSFTFFLRGIEFEPGKPAIRCKDKEELLETIDLLVEAVKARELDEALKTTPKRKGRWSKPTDPRRRRTA
jgi:hypothetical protein